MKKAKKCGVADNVTRFPNPDDPQLGFLTIVAVEAVKNKKRKKDGVYRVGEFLANLVVYSKDKTRK